jgi:uncharacterized membrane protein YfcA
MTAELAVALVVAGLVVGGLSALFGVGGGLLMVPFIVLVLHEGQHLAEGTSLLVIVPTALAGAFVHWRNGYVSLPDAALLALGGSVGVYVGASLALGTSGGNLQLAFGVFLAVMGARNVWQGAQETRK